MTFRAYPLPWTRAYPSAISQLKRNLRVLIPVEGQTEGELGAVRRDGDAANCCPHSGGEGPAAFIRRSVLLYIHRQREKCARRYIYVKSCQPDD